MEVRVVAGPLTRVVGICAAEFGGVTLLPYVSGAQLYSTLTYSTSRITCMGTMIVQLFLECWLQGAHSKNL